MEWSSEWKNRQSKGGEFMDEAKKLVVLEQENEELKRELKELFKTLDQMNQSLNRMIDHYILCKTEKAG
jgi:predicted transcriptional regulator